MVHRRSRLKSRTPECAKIEQFTVSVVPGKSYLICIQDSDILEFQGRSISITEQQIDDGTWQEIVRKALAV